MMSKKGLILLIFVCLMLAVPFSAAVCTDSDGGKNLNVKGEVTSRSIEGKRSASIRYFDLCVSGDKTKIIETYCENGLPKVGTFSCQSGYECSRGACIAVTPPAPIVCTDSDGGKDYYAAGSVVISEGGGDAHARKYADECFGSGPTLKEWFCINNSRSDEMYKCPKGCKDGACVGVAGAAVENKKNMTKYSTRQTFLISDTNWKDILPLVPLTTWTGNETTCTKGYGTESDVCVYPTLIYHQETSGFDADSIIHFMQQYSPDKLIIVGQTPQELNNLLVSAPALGAGLTTSKIARITTNDYFSYWTYYNNVVYVEDNYELALLASTYASLINAPLVIKGTYSDNKNVFAGKAVICVGNVVLAGNSCSKSYNLEQLQKEYINKTNTDKIILVNSNDLSIKVNETFKPEKSANSIGEIYGKTSLASPILAGAKHEIIISMNNTGYKVVDSFFNSKLYSFFNVSSQLTEGKTCSLGESCSSEFFKRENMFLVSQDSIKYNLTLKRNYSHSAEAANLYVGAVFTLSGCGGKNESVVEMYNNGKLISNRTIPCNLDNSSIYFQFPGYDFRNVFSLESGELELRSKGNTFIARLETLGIHVWDKMQEDLVFGCVLPYPAQYSSCMLTNLSLKGISGFYSLGQSTYNFADFDNKSRYFISTQIYTSTDLGIIKIYANGDLIYENFSYMLYNKLIEVPSYLIRDKLNVKIVTNPNKNGQYGDYYAKVLLRKELQLPYYLTIVASPNDIPISKSVPGSYWNGREWQKETDGRFYGSLNDEEFINIPVGRIMGLSSSDISAYVARDLLFNRLSKNKDALSYMSESHAFPVQDLCRNLDPDGRDLDPDAYMDCTKNATILERYAREYVFKDALKKEFGNLTIYSGAPSPAGISEQYGKGYLTLFNDHGWEGGFVGMMDSDYLTSNKIYFQPGFVLAVACSTCYSIGLKGSLFCVQGLRRGMLAQQGAVDVSYWHDEFYTILEETILKNKTIGEAYLKARNEEFIRNNGWGDPYYALLGDPTWRPRWW